jgi:chemotaxis protein MotB
MSFRRKIYDGTVAGRDTGIAEWRSAFSNESKTNKHASTKGTKKNPLRLATNGIGNENESDKDRYLITYADVITLLLGLFIILYAISNIDLLKYDKMKKAFESSFGVNGKIVGITKEVPAITVAPVDELKDHLMKLVNENGYGNSIRLEENERGLTIHILEEIMFNSGKADIQPYSLNPLNKIAGILKNIKNDIRVEGHTDNVPISNSAYQSNWHLSVARALNTAYYLINEEGLQAERVSIVGCSEYRPIASNEFASGRELNRRVDIVIIKN